MMERRKFVKDCCTLAIGLPVAGAVFASCTSRYFAQIQMSGNRILVRKSEFSFLKNEKRQERNFVFIRIEDEFPICLIKLDDSNYTASLMYCSHQGCETQLEGEIFVCPCHGSEFTKKGKLMKGPADSDLKTYKTESDDENIYIYL